MDVPDVSYARSGDVAIAYQVVGDGPTDIVFVRGTLADLLGLCSGSAPATGASFTRRCAPSGLTRRW